MLTHFITYQTIAPRGYVVSWIVSFFSYVKDGNKKMIEFYLLICIIWYDYRHSDKQNTLRECNIATNNLYVGAIYSTIYMTCLSCKSRDCYKNRIIWPNIVMPLVQGHPVVFVQNSCYIRIEYYFFYMKNARNHFMLFVKYS